MADDHEEEIPRSSLEEQNDVAEIQIQMDNLKGRRRIENDQTSQRTEQKEGVPGRQSNQEIALLQVDPIQETKAFNVTRLKTQSSNEEIRNQMKFILKGDFKNIYARNLPLPAAVVLIDRANNISEEYSNILRTALDLVSHDTKRENFTRSKLKSINVSDTCLALNNFLYQSMAWIARNIPKAI